MKDKKVMIITERRVYYLTLRKHHWWSKWKIESISDNETTSNRIIKKIIELK